MDEDCERIELPTDEQDKTLGLQTLNGAFPGAHGLKYKNQKTGAFRALLIDATGTKFHPPTDGWEGKVFVVLSRLQTPATPSDAANSKPSKKSDQNAKRRKLMVESDTADSCDSDAEAIGKSYTENAQKRQQGASKQKRMMGNIGNGGKDRQQQEAAEEEEELPNKITDLLVLGLPFELTDDELKAYFEAFGKVVHCEVKTQKGSTSNRGFGFVQMADLESQQKVLKQKVHQISGRECQVKIPFTKNALSSKVFIGRIREGTTTVELRKFFTEEAHKIDADSSVTDVYIPRPFRNFAFVTFSSPAVAKEMIKRGQFTLGDASIYASSAHSTRPHTQQEGLQLGQLHQQHRNNLMQAATNQQGPQRPSHPFGFSAEEIAYNEWYCDRRGGMAQPHHQIPGMHSNRVAGPMFTGSAHSHQNPPPPIPTYSGTPPAAVAGNQMLNQLETLNLNNIGIQTEVVNAIKAIFSVATASNPPHHQQMYPKGAAYQQNIANHQPQPPYHHHSLSLSPPPQPSGGSSPGRAYVPPPAQHSSHLQGRRQRHDGNNGGSGSSNHAGSGWR